MNDLFKLENPFEPAGDQPQAIETLVKSVHANNKFQTLLGVTGSGKTYTIAHLIQQIQKPTLVIAHNKTLAAQLAQEYRSFFPHNAVHYFVSYYDYYQPEAYMPITDTYIEKDASINAEIDRLRHASTQALLTRSDVIIVASVSCIYGLGSPEEYKEKYMLLTKGQGRSKRELMEMLVQVHYERTQGDLIPGQFRSVGSSIEIMPVSQKILYRLELKGNTIDHISVIDPVSSTLLEQPQEVFVFPAKHFLTEGTKKESALVEIKKEMEEHVAQLERRGMLLEAERLRRRTTYDLAMIREVGYCSGIENYSRHLSGKNPGDPPETLLSYFPHGENGKPEFLTVIDESHVTLPQIRGMQHGDRSRKTTLIEHGFRLPSALDNRPLNYEEFLGTVGQLVYVSATPGDEERTTSIIIAEQIIRPTGLVDPLLDVKPVTPTSEYPGQIQDFIAQAIEEISRGGRVLATTLTKKMAEDLTEYLRAQGIVSEYVHSDIKTIERIQILTRFRKGDFDCLVGVNLLREGLDLPEVTFIGILDADKEGFLRSETSLIQTIGRAARNEKGRVVLYADHVTGSMDRAMQETHRRRDIQLEYNKIHGITPRTIEKKIHDITEQLQSDHARLVQTELDLDMAAFKDNPKKLIAYKEEQMAEAVAELDFETAAILRDELAVLKEKFSKNLKRKDVKKS